MINFDRLLGNKENLSAEEVIDIGLFYFDFNIDDFNMALSVDLILLGKLNMLVGQIHRISNKSQPNVLQKFKEKKNIITFDQSITSILIMAIFQCGTQKGLYKKQLIDEDDKWAQDEVLFKNSGTKTLYQVLCNIKQLKESV